MVRALARFFFQVKNLWQEIKDAMVDIARESGVDNIRRELEDEYIRDMKMIEGDDGNYYPAYDMGEVEKITSSSQTPSSQQKLGSISSGAGDVTDNDEQSAKPQGMGPRLREGDKESDKDEVEK